jgi:hypothetical protein
MTCEYLIWYTKSFRDCSPVGKIHIYNSQTEKSFCGKATVRDGMWTLSYGDIDQCTCEKCKNNYPIKE